MAEQRYQAVLAVISDGLSISQAAAKVGVSRQTLHAWLARYEAEGLQGLIDRSYRPASCPHQMAAEIEAGVIDTLECPRWSASTRADRPSSSINVAAVLRNEWVVTPGTPSWSRTFRHCYPCIGEVTVVVPSTAGALRDPNNLGNMRTTFPVAAIVCFVSSKSVHRNASSSDRRSWVAISTVIGSTRSFRWQ